MTTTPQDGTNTSVNQRQGQTSAARTMYPAPGGDRSDTGKGQISAFIEPNPGQGGDTGI